MNIAWRKNACKPVGELAGVLHRLGLDFAHFRGLLVGNTFIGIVHARKATHLELADAVMESFSEPSAPMNGTVQR